MSESHGHRGQRATTTHSGHRSKTPRRTLRQWTPIVVSVPILIGAIIAISQMMTKLGDSDMARFEHVMVTTFIIAAVALSAAWVTETGISVTGKFALLKRQLQLPQEQQETTPPS